MANRPENDALDLHKEVVFSLWSHRRLSVTASVAEAVDVAARVTKARPEFLSPEAVARNLYFFPLLGEFKYSGYYGYKHHEDEPLSQVPVKEIGRVLESWVESTYKDPYGLVPQLALATADFVYDLVAGHLRGRGDESWKVEPVVAWSEGEADERRFFPFDRQFKKDFTQRTRASLCVARVPEGGSVTIYDKPFLRPGSLLFVSPVRCYMSDNFMQGRSIIGCHGVERRFDTDIELPCRILTSLPPRNSTKAGWWEHIDPDEVARLNAESFENWSVEKYHKLNNLGVDDVPWTWIERVDDDLTWIEARPWMKQPESVAA